MPCTGQSLTSPSITCLDFLVEWNLSGVPATVVITDNSTVSNYGDLNWWLFIAAPSGAVIYGQNLTGLTTLPPPDFTGNWTPQTINIPTPLGEGICGQVEFSPNVPYIVTLYVQDTASSPLPLYSYTKPTILVRPGGNNQAGSNLPNSCGNFGGASINMLVVCASNTVQVQDQTSLFYNNIAPAGSPANTWTLVSPPAPSGSAPVVTTVTNESSTTFTATVDSAGYMLYFSEYATYSLGNGITVVIQYKLFDSFGNLGVNFAVNCNVSMCTLICNLGELYQLANTKPGVLESQNALLTITKITPLLFQLLMAQSQPLCGANVPALLQQINIAAKFNNNCGCNENSNITTYPA